MGYRDVERVVTILTIVGIGELQSHSASNKVTVLNTNWEEEVLDKARCGGRRQVF